MIYIRLVRGMAWDSKGIEYFSHAWCSHAEFFLPKGAISKDMTFGAQLAGGVRYRAITDSCYRNMAKWTLWAIPTTAAQDVTIQKFINDTTGLPYDWRAIVNFFIPTGRDWREPDSWFCSELCVRGLELAGLVVVPPDLGDERIDPVDLEELISQVRGAKIAQSWIR